MIAQGVADILSHHVKLSVEGIDRMYLNVYVPWLQTERGVVQFFRGPSFYSGSSQTASAPPICATILLLCRAAIPKRSRRGPSLSAAPSASARLDRALAQ
jgi:hypothetical protein